MQRLVVDVEDRYLNLVTDLLSNLKQNIVKNITIEKRELKKNDISHKLEQFRKLRKRSNNKTTLTMAITTNTDEMTNDGLL